MIGFSRSAAVALASLVLLVLAAAPSEANIVSDRSLQEGIPAEIAASTEVPVCELACEHSTLPNASCTGCECKGLYSGNLCQKCKTTSECDLGSIWSEETCDCVAETDKEDDACITETCYGNGSCTKEPVDCNDGNPCTDDLCYGGQCTHTPIPNCGGCPACKDSIYSYGSTGVLQFPSFKEDTFQGDLVWDVEGEKDALLCLLDMENDGKASRSASKNKGGDLTKNLTVMSGCNGNGWSLSKDGECKSCEYISQKYEKYGLFQGPNWCRLFYPNDGRGIFHQSFQGQMTQKEVYCAIANLVCGATISLPVRCDNPHDSKCGHKDGNVCFSFECSSDVEKLCGYGSGYGSKRDLEASSVDPRVGSLRGSN